MVPSAHTARGYSVWGLACAVMTQTQWWSGRHREGFSSHTRVRLSPFILLPLPHPITLCNFILTLTPVSQKVDMLEPFLHFAVLVLDHVRGIRLSKEVWESVILDCQ